MAKIRKREQIIVNRRSAVLKSHCFKDYLKTSNGAYARFVQLQFSTALSEDEGVKGDITSKSLIDENLRANADVIAREEGILAGMEEAKWFFEKKWRGNSGKLDIVILKHDGEQVKKNETVMSLRGRARDLLLIERTLLNMIQRMSGIATATQRLVDLAGDVLVCGTRKTVMGPMDKKGVVAGGGGTHRINLSDAVLIKNNHIDLTGDIGTVAKHISNKEPKARFIEIEARDGKEAVEAAEHFYERGLCSIAKMPVLIMFDNMRPGEIKKTLNVLKEKKLYGFFLFEASGGICAKNIMKYAESGVDIVSSGAITHSVRSIDFSMKISRGR